METATRLEFPNGDLFHSHTGGFGEMVIETGSIGLKYIGDGWNLVQISFDVVVAPIGINAAVVIHACCIDESGRAYDYDDRMLRKRCFFYSREVIRIHVDDGATSLLMPMLERVFHSWLEQSGTNWRNT